jgi:hypothetical protein
MEQRYEFEGAEVRALLGESAEAAERLMTEAQRYVAAGVDLHAPDAPVPDEIEHPGTGAAPGLWLVNDRGIYLRSNAKKRAADSVAYARGFRGDVQVGDDTVCEYIDGALLAPLQDGDTLVVTLAERKLRLSLLRGG